MEEKVMIPGPEATLEGLFQSDTGGGVIITHPHPLFGGSMDNNVVWTAVRAFQARRWATLRFNFRGVGRSSGMYGGGQAEAADVVAALAFLMTRTPGPYYLVGYSFGAYVAAQALVKGLEAQGGILISPPINFMDLAFLPEVPRLELIVVGDRDELCPLAALKSLLMSLVDQAASRFQTTGQQPVIPRLRVIAGADHFFWGQEAELFQVLRDFPLRIGKI